jgi:hypothetical protein
MKQGLAILAALALLSSAACAETRTYCGKLASSGHMVPAETGITRNDRGELIGTYTFVDGTRVFNGTLAPATPMAKNSWRFIWTDDYGSGELDVKFNADQSAFTGKWGDGHNKPRLPWNGKLGSGCLAIPST